MLICLGQQISAPLSPKQKHRIKAGCVYAYQDCELDILQLMAQLTPITNCKQLKLTTILNRRETLLPHPACYAKAVQGAAATAAKTPAAAAAKNTPAAAKATVLCPCACGRSRCNDNEDNHIVGGLVIYQGVVQ